MGFLFYLQCVVLYIYGETSFGYSWHNSPGKGLTTWEILKFLFYMSVKRGKMVLPLTILLASIMTLGDFRGAMNCAINPAEFLSPGNVTTFRL